MNICEYCEQSFTKYGNMLKHQRTAKYCLKLQGKELAIDEHQCDICEKTFARKDVLRKHRKKCLADQEQKQKEDQLLNRINIMENTIKNLAGGNAVNRNNVTMNLRPVTDEMLAEHLDRLTLHFIQEGAKGYAGYAGDYSLKNAIVCTDRSRKKIKFKDEYGNIISDGGGVKITKMFFNAIRPRNEEIINAEYSALQEQVQEIATQGTAGTSDLVGILTQSTQLQDLLVKCREAAIGKQNDLTRDFIRHLSKLV